MKGQFEIFVRRSNGQRFHRVTKDLVQVEFGLVEVEFSRFDF